MKNKMQDLRDHLFATLEALQDPDKPMDLERATVIAKTAQVLVNSAKVEVDFVKVAGGKGSGFIDPEELPALGAPGAKVHRITDRR